MDKVTVNICSQNDIRANIRTPKIVTSSFTGVHVGRVTEDYDKLKNLPTINGVEIRGNKTANDFGIAPVTDYSQLQNLPVINGAKLSGGENSLVSLGIARASNLDINKLF